MVKTIQILIILAFLPWPIFFFFAHECVDWTKEGNKITNNSTTNRCVTQIK